MSYAALVRSNVKLAFKLIKDLAKPATFVKKASTFNFETANTVSTQTQKVFLTVMVDGSKKSEDRNTFKKTLLVEYSAETDLSLYDHVIIDSVVWKIEGTPKTDGYLFYINVVKE